MFMYACVGLTRRYTRRAEDWRCARDAEAWRFARDAAVERFDRDAQVERFSREALAARTYGSLLDYRILSLSNSSIMYRDPFVILFD